MTIAVSGYGIAGLSAALAAANAGKDVTICSSAPNTAPAGGIQLAPNGWRALDQLGIRAAAMAQATRLSHIHVRDLDSGVTLTRLPLENHYASISRAALFSILQDTITTTARIAHHPASITQAVSHDNSIDMICDDGRSVTAAALIAADGVGGFGRRFVSGTSATPQTKRVAMRIEIVADQLPALFSQATSNLWLGQGAHLVHYPIAGGTRINFAVTLSAQRSTSTWQTDLFGNNPVLACLANSAFSWTKTPLPAAGSPICWRRGRVVLAGDAAHIMPPHLAQGAGQALQDAASLYSALTASGSVHEALGIYARDRSTAVSRVVQKAEISGKVMAMGGAAGRLRNILINVAGPSFLQSWLADVWAGDPRIAN